MKKITEFVKKYKTEILVLLVVVFLFRSCSSSSKVRKLEKIKTENTILIDSLNKLVPSQNTLTLGKLKSQLEVYDFILDEMTKQKITCGDFREEYVLKPKQNISKKIKELENIK